MAAKERKPPTRSITFTGGHVLQAPQPAAKDGSAEGLIPSQYAAPLALAPAAPAGRGGELASSPFAISSPPSPSTPQPYGQHRQAPPIWEL